MFAFLSSSNISFLTSAPLSLFYTHLTNYLVHNSAEVVHF